MKITYIALLIISTICANTKADEISAEMSLEAAQKILLAAGATQQLHAYHFPWTSKFVELEAKEGETLEKTIKHTNLKLEKLSDARGYSVFFLLADKTRLELQLEVNGDSKKIRKIRLGENQKQYLCKFDWIAADDSGKIREMKSINPNRKESNSVQPATAPTLNPESNDNPNQPQTSTKPAPNQPQISPKGANRYQHSPKGYDSKPQSPKV